MDPSDIAFIKGVITFLLVAGTGMSAFRLWLRERRRGRPDVGKIVDALREENAALQAEFEARNTRTRRAGRSCRTPPRAGAKG
jgi:hypothetical protein